jgi:aminoglycoside phosphotransferase (APT) family kinase protein
MYVTGGLVASVIWLIIGTVAILFRNSEEARVANAAARASCRGQPDFARCVDAYHAANGGAPGIDWAWIVAALAIGLVVVWVIVFVLKAIGGNAAE